MADAIAPALTAEEWERRLVLVPFDGKHGPVDDATVTCRHGLLFAASPGDTLHPRIAAAALALANDALPDGHPLKITRADVEALSESIGTNWDALSSTAPLVYEESVARLRRLAAKLDALLAPEDQP